jgi:hypothetical protein
MGQIGLRHPECSSALDNRLGDRGEEPPLLGVRKTGTDPGERRSGLFRLLLAISHTCYIARMQWKDNGG